MKILILCMLVLGGCGASTQHHASTFDSSGVPYPTYFVGRDAASGATPIPQYAEANIDQTAATGPATAAGITFGDMQLTVSSGRDATFEGLVVTQSDGTQVSLDKFGALSSTPITAIGNASQAMETLLMAIKQSDTEATKAAYDAWASIVEAAVPGALDVIKGL